jgi:hypothetical protein
VWVWVKFRLLPPLIVALLKLSGPMPVLVNTTDWVALAVPTCVGSNASESGDTLADGATPAPINKTVCVIVLF